MITILKRGRSSNTEKKPGNNAGVTFNPNKQVWTVAINTMGALWEIAKGNHSPDVNNPCVSNNPFLEVGKYECR